MKKHILEYLDKLQHSRFQTKDLEKYLAENTFIQDDPQGYEKLVESLEDLIDAKKIKPILSSGINSLHPPLYNRYQRMVNKSRSIDSTSLLHYHPKIATSFYLKYPNEYEKDKAYVDSIHDFLNKNKPSEDIPINERSFELFYDEKFLIRPEGNRLLRRLDLNLNDLCCFKTYEPYISLKSQASNESNTNILIIENKDSYTSLSILFREGKYIFSNIPFHYLIYGEGDKILKSIHFLELSNLDINTIHLYYFGDLDPKGIWIWKELHSKTPCHISPMTSFYQALLNKYDIDKLPKRSPQIERKQSLYSFIKAFDSLFQNKLLNCFEQKKYIPQEGLQLTDFREFAEGDPYD
jgi:hypothetical protein